MSDRTAQARAEAERRYRRIGGAPVDALWDFKRLSFMDGVEWADANPQPTTITDLDKAGYAVVRHRDAVREYRAVFSFPESYGFSGELEAEPDSYSRPTRDRAKVPTHAPRSEETHGWVSGVQSRLVSAWGGR